MRIARTRRGFPLILGVATCLILAACSGGKSATDEPPPLAAGGGAESSTSDAASADTVGQSGEASTPAGDSVTITHWQHQSDAREAIAKALIKDYQASSGNKIDFQSIPYASYFQKLGAALEAGNGPCVFQLPANILAEFEKRGELAPVPEDLMTAQEIEDTFTPASIRLLKIDGKYYGMPTDFQTLLLFYNDDLFKAAGLDPTKDFTSWDQLVDAAKKLTKVSGGQMVQTGVDIAASPYQWYYSAPTLAFADGLVNDETHQVNYASDAGYQVWKRLTDLVTVHHVSSADFLKGQNAFALGKAGMTLREYTFTGVFKLTAPDVKFSVHIAPPVADKTHAPVASTSWSYAVAKDCATPAQAWDWVAHLTSADAELKWAAGGGELPSRKALVDDPELRSDPNVAAGLDSMADAVPYDSMGWDDAFAIQQEIWDEITLGGVDVKTAVDKGAAAEDALYRKKGLIE